MNLISRRDKRARPRRPVGRTHVIGIAGPSCAGKSSLAKCLSGLLNGGVSVVTLDNYYHDLSGISPHERSERDFDVPDALDWGRMVADLGRLSKGHSSAIPIYSFSTHTRMDREMQIRPGLFIIVEGLYSLYDDRVRRLLHTKIFVTAGHDTCLSRRIERDVLERARTAESVRRQYERSVRPMADRYVLPTASFADVVLDGTEPLHLLCLEAMNAIRRSPEARGGHGGRRCRLQVAGSSAMRTVVTTA